MIQDLISTVNVLELNRGIRNALVSKLRSALQSVERGRGRSARNALSAFVNQVDALDGKQLDGGTVTELRQSALAIIAST